MINHHLYKNVSKKAISDQSIKEISLHRREITYKKSPRFPKKLKKRLLTLIIFKN